MSQRLWAILRKETREILRDPYTLGVAMLLPLVLLVLFGFGINSDVEDVALIALDFDRSASSRRYIQALESSGYFRQVQLASDYDDVNRALDRGTADAVAVIPPGFDRLLAGGREAPVQVLLDGSYTPSAQVIQGHVRAITAAFNQRLIAEALSRRGGSAGQAQPSLQVASRVLYNPTLESVNSVVPGLFGVILMAFPPLLSALAIVREKERGSIQQVFISPVRPVEVILGKLTPYAVIAFVELLIVLALGVYGFGIPFRGSLALFLTASAIYVAGTVGIGLLVSTLVRTQVAAMLLALALTIMPSMLFSGFIMPVHSMPEPMQAYASSFPTRYFIDLTRAVALRGQGWEAAAPTLAFLSLYAAGLVLLSSLRFRRRMG